MTDKAFFEFLTSLAVREGAWAVEPLPGAENYVMSDVMERLRLIPARITCPPGRSRDRFAERGARGRFMVIWVPEE